ncbi:MAG TPA: hypothetical protein VI753_01785 [Anaerolineales bacterium]|nr:hypothetical protein [Anaerolineales bacterium]
MKKVNSIPDDEDDMLPEYDFTGKKGVRGKYHRARQQGYTIRIRNEDGTVTEQHFGPTITLDPDVSAYLPDSESVNNALRTLIALVPNKQIGDKKAKYKVGKKPTKKIAVRK